MKYGTSNRDSAPSYQKCMKMINNFNTDMGIIGFELLNLFLCCSVIKKSQSSFNPISTNGRATRTASTRTGHSSRSSPRRTTPMAQSVRPWWTAQTGSLCTTWPIIGRTTLRLLIKLTMTSCCSPYQSAAVMPVLELGKPSLPCNTSMMNWTLY